MNGLVRTYGCWITGFGVWLVMAQYLGSVLHCQCQLPYLDGLQPPINFKDLRGKPTEEGKQVRDHDHPAPALPSQKTLALPCLDLSKSYLGTLVTAFSRIQTLLMT